ncbi:hypothetical protein [Enterococcus casseliflavus]|uniref:hypothetical protein n=1 Tax=Enterococcus casseliflavus TaxID=37734 RepID=UPI003017407D
MKMLVRTLILLEELLTYIVVFCIIFALIWFAIFKANDQYTEKIRQYGEQSTKIFNADYDII